MDKISDELYEYIKERKIYVLFPITSDTTITIFKKEYTIKELTTESFQVDAYDYDYILELDVIDKRALRKICDYLNIDFSYFLTFDAIYNELIDVICKRIDSKEEELRTLFIYQIIGTNGS